MKKLLAVMLMGALVLGAVATPAWGAGGVAAANEYDPSAPEAANPPNKRGAEKPNSGEARAGKMRSVEGARHKARRHVIRGEITQVGDGSFVMRTRKGPVTVKFNKETQYKGGDSSNLKVGAKVGVVPRGCPRKPGVNADKARAGEHKAGANAGASKADANAGAHKAGAHKGKPGLRAKFCMGVRKPQAKASAATAEGRRDKLASGAKAEGRQKTAKVDRAPGTVVARAIVFPRARTGQ